MSDIRRGCNPEQAIQAITDLARPASGYVHNRSSLILTSYRDFVTKEHLPCLSMATDVFNQATNRHHTVVIGMFADDQGMPRIDWWCGDRLLTGRMKSVEMNQSVLKAIDRLQTETTPVGGIQTARISTLVNDMQSGFRSHPINSRCNFWAKKASGQVCKHVAYLFDEIKHHRLTGMGPRKTIQCMITEWSSFDARSKSLVHLYKPDHLTRSLS